MNAPHAPDPGPGPGPSVQAGFLLGLVGMVLFGIYHWFFVAPVVAVFVEGVLWGGGAGALVGLCYHRSIVTRDRTGWRWGLAFGLVFVLALLPYEAVGLLFGPFAEIQRPSDILVMLPVTLLGLPVLALGGWLLTRDRRTTLLIMGTGFALHFFVGGSAAHFGGRDQTLALVLMMGGFELLAAVFLGPLGTALARRSALLPERSI